MKRTRNLVAGALMSALIAGAATAQTLTIGVSLETSSIDPYFYAFKSNYQVAQQIFDPLIRQDATQQFVPGLATSWKPLNETTWEIKLRQGVKWHDGSPFTADDVLFSVERAKAGIPGSATTPSRTLLQGDKEWKKIDDLTLHIVTPKPYATVPADLSESVILSRKHGAGAQTGDYNTGKAAVGTGPFKFAEYVQGDRVVLTANPDYWGGKPAWERVVMKAIPTAPARLAALLSGSVDAINDVPTEDIDTLKANNKFAVTVAPSNLVIRLVFDYGKMSHEWVKDNAGKVMFPNPLKDWRVRKALSMAIDRQRIVERVMSGTAIAAGQPQPPGGHAYNPDLKPDAYDPEGAKKLLAEAGYPQGFQLTMHTPQNRYPNDAKIAEAIVQMYQRIGVKAQLEVLPQAVVAPRAQKGELAMFLFAWGTSSGDGGNFLINGLRSFDSGLKVGAANWGRYSNRDFDDVIDQTVTEVDPAKREALVREAWKLATQDVANIWVLWVANTWASRADLAVDPRIDSFTMGTTIRKK